MVCECIPASVARGDFPNSSTSPAMGRKAYAALRHECSLAGLSQEGDRWAMQKRLQRLRVQPRTKMSHAELSGALRDLGQKVPRNLRSKKDLQRLLAKSGLKVPRNGSSPGLRKVVATSLAGFGSKSKPPTFVDYCCGMGGASLGAHQAGYRILGAVDDWQVACSSYGLNLPTQARRADLAHDAVIWDEDVDCMWASMPCQSFSTIGNRLGISDERGKLSVTFADHLKTAKPRVFVFENSPNLISIHGGYDIGIIEKAMRACGYKLFRYSLDSTDFGLCQRRRRLFIVQSGQE